MVCFLVLGNACGSSVESRTHPVAHQLILQLEESCQQAETYQKTIYDLTDFAAQGEDSLYVPIPTTSFGDDSVNYLLLEDLQYAFETFYSDPALEGEFDVFTPGDSLIASLKKMYQNKTDLQRQVIVSPENSDLITYYEVQLKKDSWLYAMAIGLQIWFDSTGLYQHHVLEVQTAVPMIQSSFHAKIDGQHTYP